MYSTAVYLAAACVCDGPGKRSDSDISHTRGGAAAFFRFYNWLHASKILCAVFNNLREGFYGSYHRIINFKEGKEKCRRIILLTFMSS